MRLLRQGFRDQSAETAVYRVIFKRSDKRAAFNQLIKCLLVKGLEGCNMDKLALFAAGKQLFIAIGSLLQHRPFKQNREIGAAIGDGGDIADPRNDAFIANRHRLARHSNINGSLYFGRLLKGFGDFFRICRGQDG